ncbi:MAG: cyoB, partial [Ramlibacter sp.]|nr:cyoB [Ramlibacter sp.]
GGMDSSTPVMPPMVKVIMKPMVHSTGVVFACLAAFTYWFPKAFGFTLDEQIGKAVFWCWFIGFYLAFMPLYALGFLGMTRRMNHSDNPAWTPYLYVAVAGAALIMVGIVLQVVQLVFSIRTRHQRRDLTGDPWEGRTLEWSTASPPPAYNFAVLPAVRGIDAHWAARRGAMPEEAGRIESIEMPKRSALGFVLAFLSVTGGFGMVWHIYWLGAASLFAALAFWIGQSWGDDDETTLTAREVEASEAMSRLSTVRA